MLDHDELSSTDIVNFVPTQVPRTCAAPIEVRPMTRIEELDCQFEENWGCLWETRFVPHNEPNVGSTMIEYLCNDFTNEYLLIEIWKV